MCIINKITGMASLAALLLGVIFLAGVTSCKKNVTGNSNANMGTFYFHFQTNIDTNIVTDTAIVYRDSSGRHFGLATAQFFVYNVVLRNTNGSTYTVPDAYILTDIDSGKYIIGYAPPGTYNAVSFNVGLDAGTDGLSPSVFVPTGYAQSISMWTGGQEYTFMSIQGFADTTAAQVDTALVNFSYAIGGPANLETVTMPVRTGTPFQPYTVVAGGTDTISVICDFGKLLSVVNFKTQDTTDTYTINPTLATTIATNIPNMFRYKQ